MVTCDTCKKTFKYNYLLIQHLERKIPCSSPMNNSNDELPILGNHVCQYCMKNLSCTKRLTSHIKICRMKDDPVRNLEIKLCKNVTLDPESKTCRFCHTELSRITILHKHDARCKKKEQYKQNLMKEYHTNSGFDSEPHKNSVYLLIEREFMVSKQNIFKIGRSANVSNRTKQYPKGSQLLVVLPCIDSGVTERNLQIVFRNKFIHRKDIGSEYYEGPPNSVIKEFIENVECHF